MTEHGTDGECPTGYNVNVQRCLQDRHARTYTLMDEIACDLMNAVSSDDLGSRSSSALSRNQAILAQASQGVSASVIFVDENENG